MAYFPMRVVLRHQRKIHRLLMLTISDPAYLWLLQCANLPCSRENLCVRNNGAHAPHVIVNTRENEMKMKTNKLSVREGKIQS